MATVRIAGFRCDRCDHEWAPREPDQAPTVCPKCKSPYWNRPRKDDVKSEHRVTCKLNVNSLNGKTVEYALVRAGKAVKGIGWFSVGDLGDGTMLIEIQPVNGDSDLRLSQAESDQIKTHTGKYRFSCFSRS